MIFYCNRTRSHLGQWDLIVVLITYILFCSSHMYIILVTHMLRGIFRDETTSISTKGKYNCIMYYDQLMLCDIYIQNHYSSYYTYQKSI
jgi:hypothetical protein